MNYLKNTNNKIAIDTNILVYALTNEDKNKQKVVENILYRKPFISNYVLFELAGVLRRKNKNKYDKVTISKILTDIIKVSNFFEGSSDVFYKSKDLVERHNFQLKDAIIIAVSLLNGCNIFYSEDGQHNRLIDNKMRILNPFVKYKI